jgi:putative peptide zinc metalloprotease protein
MDEVDSQCRFLLRFRPDLAIYSQPSGEQPFWVVKDPLALRYFRFTDQEYAILEMLDGHQSPEQICTQFEQKFAPQRMNPTRLLGFLANLHRNGLLLSDGPDQGAELLERDQNDRTTKRWASLSNVLAIRIPGIDPEPLLVWLYPKLRWCFSGWFVSACLALALAAIGVVLVHLDQLQMRLPEFRLFFNAGNLFLLFLCLASTKIIHELGHALTCQHFGGECHEMGLMLLVFTPCLYCDVSDSWILRSRWHRIAISAAGILIEIVLASLATFGWWYSRPGLFNSICLDLMVLCSVSTILINGNPLLRYDGYFIMSDFLETPNLWQQSRSMVHRTLARIFLGVDESGSVCPSQRPWLLAFYGVASMVYRVVVVITILGFLYGILKPMRLQIVAYLIAFSLPLGIVVAGVRTVQSKLENPLYPQQLKRQLSFTRLFLSVSVAASLGAGFFLVPFPCRISAPVVLELRDAQRIYVASSGILTQCVPIGEQVEKGQVIACIESAELQRVLLNIQGEFELADIRVNNLQFRLVEDPQAAQELVVAREMRADMQQQLVHHQADAQRLLLRAPIAGTVISPPRLPVYPRDTRSLPHWTGYPQEARNLGCTVDRGDLFCLIGDLTQHEAVIYVDEWAMEYVHIGQGVRMQFDLAPGAVFTGTVREIARRDTQVVPRALAAGQQLANRPAASGAPQPLETSYQVRVSLDQHSQALIIGAGGRGKVVVEPQTLSLRLWRFLRRTFTLKS